MKLTKTYTYKEDMHVVKMVELSGNKVAILAMDPDPWNIESPILDEPENVAFVPLDYRWNDRPEKWAKPFPEDVDSFAFREALETSNPGPALESYYRGKGYYAKAVTLQDSGNYLEGVYVVKEGHGGEEELQAWYANDIYMALLFDKVEEGDYDLGDALDTVYGIIGAEGVDLAWYF